MTQPLTERLRAGKNTLLRAGEHPLGETLQYQMGELFADVSEAADRIEALEATQAELVEALKASRNVLHDALMPDGIYAEDAEPVLEKINAALAKLEAGQ